MAFEGNQHSAICLPTKYYFGVIGKGEMGSKNNVRKLNSHSFEKKSVRSFHCQALNPPNPFFPETIISQAENCQGAVTDVHGLKFIIFNKTQS